MRSQSTAFLVKLWILVCFTTVLGFVSCAPQPAIAQPSAKEKDEPQVCTLLVREVISGVVLLRNGYGLKHSNPDRHKAIDELVSLAQSPLTLKEIADLIYPACLKNRA